MTVDRALAGVSVESDPAHQAAGLARVMLRSMVHFCRIKYTDSLGRACFVDLDGRHFRDNADGNRVEIEIPQPPAQVCGRSEVF